MHVEGSNAIPKLLSVSLSFVNGIVTVLHVSEFLLKRGYDKGGRRGSAFPAGGLTITPSLSLAEFKLFTLTPQDPTET